VDAAQAAFPSSVDIAGLLGALRVVASTAGVILVSVSANPIESPPTRGAVTSMPIEVRVEGTDDHLEHFLAAIRTTSRLLTTDALTFTAATATPGIVNAQISARAWFIPGPDIQQ
jgi:Tfp pilus assembly protein PilO